MGSVTVSMPPGQDFLVTAVVLGQSHQNQVVQAKEQPNGAKTKIRFHGNVTSEAQQHFEQITQKECTNMDQHVNSVITSVETNSESENNKLLASAAFLVAEMLGVKTRPKSGKSGKEPY